MKVLLAGRMDGWMGIYWEQVARGFRQAGCACRTFDYRRSAGAGFLGKLLPGRNEERLRRLRTSSLISAVREYGPDVLLLHSMRLDMPALREAFPRSLVYWDIDGPAGPLGRDPLPLLSGFDLMLTVSRPVLRRIEKEGVPPVRYLPHGADLDYYSPGPVSRGDEDRFAASMAFIGRPTERRVRHLEPLAGEGLAVFGGRWGKRPWRSKVFEPCLRERRNITGEEVVALYRAAGLVLNISREPFTDPSTTLNLQVFHVPAAGTCLLTEWVEELEDAFEPDREVLAFQGAEAFREMALKYSRDREAARRIGEAGRRRCEAHHALSMRARSMFEWVDEIRR